MKLKRNNLIPQTLVKWSETHIKVLSPHKLPGVGGLSSNILVLDLIFSFNYVYICVSKHGFVHEYRA